MKLAQLSIFTGALMLSSIVFAQGGGDRTFERMMANKERSMELFIAKQKASGQPVVVSEQKEDNAEKL